MCVHGEKVVLVSTKNKGNTGMKELTVASPALAGFFSKSRGLEAWIKLGSDNGK